MDIKKAYRGAMAALKTTKRDWRQVTRELLHLQDKYDTLSSTDPVLARLIDENERLANLNEALEREAQRMLDEVSYYERVRVALRKHKEAAEAKASVYKSWTIGLGLALVGQQALLLAQHMGWLV